MRESVVVSSVQGTIWEDRMACIHLKRLLSSIYICLMNIWVINIGLYIQWIWNLTHFSDKCEITHVH